MAAKYGSDKLASGSEGEKRFKKTREAANRKRLTTIHSLGSLTTSRLEANQLRVNQSSEDSLAQEEENVEKYGLDIGSAIIFFQG